MLICSTSFLRRGIYYDAYHMFSHFADTGRDDMVVGRDLTASINDPALPERLLAYRKRRSKLAFIAILATSALGRNLAPLFVLVNVLSVIACGFPSRRALFSEKWGFFTYRSLQEPDGSSLTSRMTLSKAPGLPRNISWLKIFARNGKAHSREIATKYVFRPPAI
jgi:hypothetical protein